MADTRQQINNKKRRLRPDRRGCIDCGELLSRQAKWRCKECFYKHARTLVGKRNHQYVENASKEAVNGAIKRRFGKAKQCTNINCDGFSTNYRLVRLKTKVGRSKGIWIELCCSCKVRLQEIYQTKKFEPRR